MAVEGPIIVSIGDFLREIGLQVDIDEPCAGCDLPCKDADTCEPDRGNDVAMAPEDPWAHRSSGMRCRTCMWFVEKAGTTSGVGRCRRHAPTMNGYPVVFLYDWCGDHKLDEKAV